MQDKLTVVDPRAAVASASVSAAGSSAQGMAGTPLPADRKPIGAPQMAPPIARTEPAYVKFDLQTTRVTALLANGVAYEYWTFNNTVPGPMLRVHVSAGGVTAVELTARVPGTFTIVHHSLARMEKGAAGQIVIDGPAQPDIFQSIKAGSGGSGGH